MNSFRANAKGIKNIVVLPQFQNDSPFEKKEASLALRVIVFSSLSFSEDITLRGRITARNPVVNDDREGL